MGHGARAGEIGGRQRTGVRRKRKEEGQGRKRPEKGLHGAREYDSVASRDPKVKAQPWDRCAWR